MRIVNYVLKAALGGAFICGLSSCASVSTEGSFQTTLIRSEPPGATIYVDGKRVGQTPEFVEIKRSMHPQIQLATSRGLEDVELPTKYRWSESFFRNFLLLVYAPVGWGIDLVTGTAWEVRETHPIDVKLAASDVRNPKRPRQPLEVVVAPPRSGSVSLSDDAAREIEKNLRESLGSRAHVRPFEQTLSTFIDNQYEHDSMPLSRRRRMLKELQADWIYESSVTADENGSWVVKSERRDVIANSTTPGPSVRLDRAEATLIFGVPTSLHSWWSRILPNTLGVDFTNEQLRADMNGQSYSLDSVYADEWWASGLRFMSAISISSTPDRRREFGSRWEFGAVPSFRFSHRRVKVGGLLPPVSGGFLERDPQFTRASGTGGYGLEIGYLINRHYLYLDIIPLVNWTEILWRQGGMDRSASRIEVTTQTELGYSYVFGASWLVKAFARTQNENTKVWQDAFVARFGAGYNPTEVTTIVSGVTLAYQFQSDRYKKIGK